MSKIEAEGIVIELGSYLQDHNQGWVSIPKAVIRTKVLTDPEFRLWSLLYSFQGEKGIFPSHQTMAETLGVSVEKIRLNVRRLRDKGFIDTRSGGFGKSNHYKLNVPKEVMDEYHKTITKTEEKLPENLEKDLTIIGLKLGRGFKIGSREIAILKADTQQYDEDGLLTIINVIFNSKQDMQRAIISYVKKFGQTPKKEQLAEFDYYIAEEGVKALLEAINKAKKTNTKIRENIEEGKKRVEQKKQFAQKRYANVPATKETAKSNPYQKQFGGFLNKRG